MEQEQVPSQQAPQQTPPQAPPVIAASPKAPRNKKLLLLVIGVILVVAAVCAGVVWYGQQGNKNTEDKAPVGFSDAASLVANVKANMTGTQAQIDTVTGLGGRTNDGYGLYGVAAYTTDNRVFKNYPAGSTGFAFKSDSSKSAENYKAIVDFFKSNMAKEIASGIDAPGYISDTPDVVNFVAYASFDTGKQICMAWHVDASETPIGAHVASLGCADKSSYASAAKGLDAFYAVLKKDDKAKLDTLVLGVPVLGGGESGYEYAIVHMELEDVQYEALYYRTTGDKSWTHHLSTHGTAVCDDFNDVSVKKAFDGFECLDDTGTVATVKS